VKTGLQEDSLTALPGRLRLSAEPSAYHGSAKSRRIAMAVARVTELISASKKSFEDAIQQGVSRAVKTLKNVEGVWVANQKCVIKKGKIDEYRVNLKVTFILQD
jgi:flavin-binding protein dodecin